jgi:preprotein translocase subunit YajC
MFFFDSVAFAMAPPAGGEGGGGNPLTAFMPLILMFAIFYFLLIRPQQKKAKQHKEMLQSLGKGDYVLTGGGIYGRITGVSGDVLTVEIAPEMSIRINRQYIASKADPSEAKVRGPKGKSKAEKESQQDEDAAEGEYEDQK